VESDLGDGFDESESSQFWNIAKRFPLDKFVDEGRTRRTQRGVYDPEVQVSPQTDSDEHFHSAENWHSLSDSDSLASRGSIPP